MAMTQYSNVYLNDTHLLTSLSLLQSKNVYYQIDVELIGKV